MRSWSRNPFLILAVLLALFALAGCAAVGGVFKAGMWVGAVAVAIIVLLGLGLVRVAGGH